MYNPFKPEKPAAAPAGPLTLATVGAVSEEGVTLILPGASEPTQAHYPNFSSSSLESGDSVIISRVSGTWVVMGKSGGGGGGGGGGGSSDYNDLSNKPSINGNTLRGNKTAEQLGLRTAAAQDAIDAAQDAEIGIVITGKRPSMAVTAGQYVIVRNSTISGIADGLYTANAALSPSTDVTAADLTAVSDGGLNSLGAHIADNFAPFNQLYVTGYSSYKMTLPSLSGHFVFFVSSSLSRSAILYIVVQSSGAVAVEEIQKGNNFAYTVGTNEVTFSTGATYAVYIKEIPIRGNPISVEPVS